MEPILHLSLPVADLDAARAFYVDTLGCSPGQRGADGMDIWFYGLQLTLQHRPDEVVRDDQQGVRHFGVTFDRAALDALLTRLQALPVRWVSTVSTDTVGALRGKTSAKLADPSGNVIEFKAYDDPSLALGTPAGKGEYPRYVPSAAGDVIIRPAAARDVERIAEIMHGEPMPELLALVGDPERASKFGKGLVMLERIPNAARPTVVAERDGAVVGVLQYTLGPSDQGVTMEGVRLALKVAGPVRFARGLPRLRARQRVELVPPPEAFYVAELHVDPARRSEGVGARLLAWADDEAARLGRTSMALTTHSSNRARHLYERAGYVVTGERTDPGYERYTGIPGRVLMEKRLS